MTSRRSSRTLYSSHSFLSLVSSSCFNNVSSLTSSSLSLFFSSSSSSMNGSSSGGSDPLNYLRTWVGGGGGSGQQQPQKQTQRGEQKIPPPPPTLDTKNNTAANTTNNNNKPLHLTGSSYLIPTLRLERYDTPQSIHERLEYAFTNKGSLNSVRTLLGVNQHHQKQKMKKEGWVVPIVLDLACFQPDGSPHYKAPAEGTLFGFVEMLKRFRIVVVGVANPPTASSTVKDEEIKMSMEKEAMVLGLPSIMPRGRAAAASVSGGNRGEMVIHVKDVIQLVLDTMEKENEEEWSRMQQEFYGGKENHHDDERIEQEKRHNDMSSYSSTTASSENDPTDSQTSSSFSSLQNDKINETQQQSTDTSANNESIEPSPSSQPPPTPPESTLYHGSVRSGQQVTSKPNQSLIILGSVNSGGEVLSDGDIFVFGKLRGRALAGLAFEEEDEEEDNDKNKCSQARIFATNFDPELICIGNTFTTVDDVHDVLGKSTRKEGDSVDEEEDNTLSVMVSLDDHGELSFEQISI